ncbi:MAG: fluoride efflux transporter CrcB [Pseudomonadales bacterium]|uniref:Fluoride-specific ion channel FluC n=1 Tax=Oleiphilus messinensis TaxID=141451 RepID=A0A1Y0ID33_9GAMM|nr:fluoride efflux transporter CrcB [Oleiphilus messinensis]ARU57304.1 putative fluoride exporter [Oleiphilus messinensis]MCG8614035.1 fluoride efflux transporter CrcB [Pseudomonadales bacterium]
MLTQILAVALGGALGAVCRYLVIGWVSTFAGTQFPFGTLAVNILGSFLMGVLYVVVIQKMHAYPEFRAVTVVGFLGAFTTFSTYSLEAFLMLQEGRIMQSVIYTLSSVILCVLAIALGIYTSRSLLS